MSSSFIVEAQEGDSEIDDTLILMVNDTGVISVDQETLQNLIINQSNASISVVRLGQIDNDAAEGNITLTVDPPAIISPDSSNVSAASVPLIDPFTEMDPEQLARLETALQSEEAKQILGENVTAILDMLSVEERQNSIRYSIELDHCYTSRPASSQSKPNDPLIDMAAADAEKTVCMSINQPTTLISAVACDSEVASMPPKIVKQPVLISTTPRRASVAAHPIVTTLKPTVNVNTRSISEFTEQEKKDKELADENELVTSESSKSEESDSDSDFRPIPKRGVRARGGRRGLTTRGGGISTFRKRGSNKQMDSEQVRRLNCEMATAVNSMKSSQKEEKSDKQSPHKLKKLGRTLGAKKKDDEHVPSTKVNEYVSIEPNVLQTTNQVKANLISANMFKGDMILTKPGQDRHNRKVMFVQKQQIINSNDLKTVSNKKQAMVSKFKHIANSKVHTVKDINVLTTLAITKPATLFTEQSKDVCPKSPQVDIEMKLNQNHIQLHKVVAPVIARVTHVEKKKEKIKVDIETSFEALVEPFKAVESTTLSATKKAVKKEHRKSDALEVEVLGPALFSTPDIIRRVASAAEIKTPDINIVMSSTPSSYLKNSSATISVASKVIDASTISTNIPVSSSSTATHALNEPMETKVSVTFPENETLPCKLDTDTSLLPQILKDKIDVKLEIDEFFQPALSTGVIERDDHLLATLGIETVKPLPNDEELLAEALLLHETLGVDLDHSGISESSSKISELILSPSVIELKSPVLIAPIETEPTQVAAPVTSCLSSKPPKVAQRAQVPITKSDLAAKKVSRDPIQIIRGGRVITLPPIEAPATRSKRLQVKTEVQDSNIKSKQQDQSQHEPRKKPSIVRNKRTTRNVFHVSLQRRDMIYNMDEDDEEQEEVNSDSEDDPNRLWCVCRQPHNNRFMICCDICQDWFHGKCVHVTKAMGEQMESQGIEWVCPNCSKKKNNDCSQLELLISNQQYDEDAILSAENRASSLSEASSVKNSELHIYSEINGSLLKDVTHCVVCRKEARKASIYCSDACILAHAEVTTTKDKPISVREHLKEVKTQSINRKSDESIILFDKKTGKVLTGADAPTQSNLKAWLREYPTYEAVKSNNPCTIQLRTETVADNEAAEIRTNKQKQVKLLDPAKIIPTKVSGSKPSFLASNTKNIMLPPYMSAISPVTFPKHYSKQVATATPGKNLVPSLKQTIIKPMHRQQPQQQQTSQKSITTSTSKPALSKKPQEATSLASQQQLSQQLQQQQEPIKASSCKKAESEPIRLNVKKTLAEQLSTRIKGAKDLTLSEAEILELALQIELQMFKYFKDTGTKYKAKYRSLLFNIKDMKNLTLFRKIADRSLTPEAVIKLSPDEMASQELAEWREKENKHQLEMIKKNELDLMSQAKSIVVKTHKGELIIENDGEGAIERVDPKTDVQDIVTALNRDEDVSSTIEKENQKDKTLMNKVKTCEGDNSKKKKKKKEKEHDREKRCNKSNDRLGKASATSKRNKSKSTRHGNREFSRSRDRKSKHKGRLRDKEKKEHKSRDRSKKKEKEKKNKREQNRSHSRCHSKNKHMEFKEKQKDEGCKREALTYQVKALEHRPPDTLTIEDRLWRHIEDETTNNTSYDNDSDVSDREPSSTVTIKTPDINEDLDRELLEARSVESATASSKTTATVWRGFVYMADVAKFFVTAQSVSGNSRELMKDLPDTFDVVGRINPATVWDYINKMKKNANKEILIVKLTATNDEERIPYITLYSYLNSRNRLGVLGNISPNIKDFYIMPFSNDSMLPSVLMPLESPGSLEEKRRHLLLGIIVVHSRKKRPAGISAQVEHQPAKLAKQESVFSPAALKEPVDKPRTPLGPELQTKNVFQSICSSSNKMQLDDDDEPYSPSEPVNAALGVTEDALSFFPESKQPGDESFSPKCSMDLQRKMDELSRQIEEEKQQIQSISFSFLGDSSTALPVLDLDPSDNSDIIEACNPSDARSFTPPPQGLSKLTQPILDTVSNITIPPNLQEILANVKRQEISKLDPYLPSKPGATFLTTVHSGVNQCADKYIPICGKTSSHIRLSSDTQSSLRKEIKSTLSSLSDYDIMKKAEEELAALAASVTTDSSGTMVLPPGAPSNYSNPSPPLPAGTSCAILRR